MTTKNQTDLIIVKDVSVSFTLGDEVINPLQNVNFAVKQNSFNIIYGASGSGKSTLLNVLTGLQKPTKGEVTIQNSHIYSVSSDELARFRANEIGFVYQSPYWIKSLNVVENVAMPLYFLGYTREAAKKVALQALERVRMAHHAKQFPFLLSGGEQQRVAVARALVNEPSFIIADEPTGALDSKNGDFIMNLLQECYTDLQQTIILVTHNMEYLPLADMLLHIQDGKVEELSTSKINETTEGIFKEMRERIKRLSEAKRHA